MYRSPRLLQIKRDELTAEARKGLSEELIMSLGEEPYLHDVSEEYRLLFDRSDDVKKHRTRLWALRLS
jgi:hypothetical protein